MTNKILFIKGLVAEHSVTELNAQNVLNDPKYDNNPYINKQAIIEAFERYEKYLNPLNKEMIPSLLDTNINVEGHFISCNIPEIQSIVYDKSCTKEQLYPLLDQHDDLTHVALSSYAIGIDNCIELIKTIKSEFSHLKLLVGGFGTLYSQIQYLVNPKDLCIGDGVNFLRKKFNLPLLRGEDFKIPRIKGNVTNFPFPFKASYLITQLGCSLNCDFCATNKFFNYTPLSTTEKIISHFKEISSESHSDLFVYICDPNAFYPEQRWRKIFDYFLNNPNEIDNNIYMMGPSSLGHINNFEIERIQEKSPLKFIGLNYGIESTLNEGYAKNKGNAEKIINRLNKNNIITYHTSILGLPIHNKNNINLDIKNHCNYKSDVISFGTFKPIPGTALFRTLEREQKLLFDKIPPEFYYMEGYMPFKHPHLGYGFDILPYAFKSYYESEKHLLSMHLNLADKLIDLFALSNNRRMQSTVKILILLGKQNFNYFKSRMPPNLSEMYQKRYYGVVKKTSINPKKLTLLSR